MSSVNTILESIDVGRIDTEIYYVNEQLNILLGDKDNKSLYYPVSNTNIASDKTTQAMLNAIASRVTKWNKALRNWDTADGRRQYIYIMASVIQPLAKKFRDFAASKIHGVVKDHDYDIAYHTFSELYNENKRFRGVAKTFYNALLSTIDELTPTLSHTSIRENSAAQAKIGQLHDKLRIMVHSIEPIVKNVVDIAGLSEQVDEQSITDAAVLLMAARMLRDRVFGAEDVGTQHHEDDAATALNMYNIMDKSWSSNPDSLAIVKGLDGEYTADELAQMVKERGKVVAKDDEIKPSDATDEDTDEYSNESGASDTTVIIKDMKNLGDNKDQLSVVNNKTKFTCRHYYKLFAIDYLGTIPYESADKKKNAAIKTHRYVYKLMYLALSAVGYPFDGHMVSKQTADKFAAYVKDIFAKVSKSTPAALDLHTNLLDALDDLETRAGEDFENFHRLFVMGEPDDNSVDQVKKAFDNIRRYMVFDGEYSIGHGVTGSGENVTATRMAEPVYSFKEFSSLDRITKTGLTTAGDTSRKFFNLVGDNLVVSSTDNLAGMNINVDQLPIAKVKNIYNNYVSSTLVPAIVSKSEAWVVLCGILAFSVLKNGTTEDNLGLSVLKQKSLDVLSSANMYNDTRVDRESMTANRLSNPILLGLLNSCHFLPPEDLHNAQARMQLVNAVTSYAKVNPNIHSEATALVYVCEPFVTAVTTFAKQSEAGQDATTNALYTVAPTLAKLVQKKADSIKTMITSYLKSTGNMGELGRLMSNVCTQYRLMTDYAKSAQAYLCIKHANELITYIGTLLTKARVAKAMDLARSIASLNTPEYTEVVDQIIKIYNAVKQGDQTESVAAAKERVDEIVSLVNQFAKLCESVITPLEGKVDDIVGQLINSEDNAAVKKLYEDLLAVVDRIDARHVTVQTVLDVQKAVASCMTGDAMTNLRNLSQLHINQVIFPIKIFITLMNMGKTSDSEKSVDDAFYSIPAGGEQPFNEINAMDPHNAENASFNQLMKELDDDIYGASIYDDVPQNGEYAQTAVKLLSKLETAKDKYDEAMDAVDTFVSTVDTDETDPVKVVRMVLDNPQIHKSIKNAAKKCKKELLVADASVKYADSLIQKMQTNYPSFKGLFDAVAHDEVSVDDIQYVINEVDAAKSILNDLTKYGSAAHDDEEDAERKVYSYTKSDEASIAQIINVLGTYLFVPNANSGTDLVEALQNIDETIGKFSGNGLSVKVSKKVLKDIGNAANDVEQLSVAIVKDIKLLGKMILSHDDKYSDLGMLQNINGINKPSDLPEYYGQAIDAFGKAMMRDRGNSKELTGSGKSNEAERVARQTFAKALIADVESNIELSKYAYLLGKAFDSFDRVLRDERVNAIDTRPFHSIIDSFTGVKLWGMLAQNDLQRELVSAIIDDERKGDQNYPTVQEVVTAAKNGSSYKSYPQMYATMLGNYSDAISKEKNTDVAFNDKGNKVDASSAVPLDLVTISFLATAGTYDKPASDVKGLVHAIRMYLCNQITKQYGKINEAGDVAYEDNYRDKATILMTAAIKSLYRLCDGFDTPIAEIIAATDTAGNKAGREAVMTKVKEQLGDEAADLDIEAAGLVADEPGAFPQMMSSRIGGADIDWVKNIRDILSTIPDSVSVDDLMEYVEMYRTNQIGRAQLAHNPDSKPVIKAIEQLFQLDSSTGMPVGFWGDTSTQRYDTLQTIFERLCTAKGDTWAERAQNLCNLTINALKSGKNILSIGAVKPSREARKRIAHMRMNPNYAVTKYDLTKQDAVDLINDVKQIGLVNNIDGDIVKINLPGMTVDRRTFKYIVMMAIRFVNDPSYKMDNIKAFATALMCYKTGVRMDDYLELLEDVVPFMTSDDNAQLKHSAHKLIDEKYNTQYFHNQQNADADMVKTNLGWLTMTTYMVLIAYAAQASEDTSKSHDIVTDFEEGFDKIASSGTRSTDIKDIFVDTDDAESETVEDELGDVTTIGAQGEPIPEPQPKVKGNESKKGKGKNGTKGAGNGAPVPEIPAEREDLEDPDYGMVDEDGTQIAVYGANEPVSQHTAEPDAEEDIPAPRPIKRPRKKNPEQPVSDNPFMDLIRRPRKRKTVSTKPKEPVSEPKRPLENPTEDEMYNI